MGKAANSTTTNKSSESNLRFERKFVYQNCHSDDILNRIYQNAFGFQEVFHQRKINNIYFDNAQYGFYKQNVAGVANRKKLRLRWYGNQTAKIENPTVEVKKKMGEVGDKDSYRIKDVSLDLEAHSVNDVHAYLIENSNEQIAVHEILRTVHPTLLNTYYRRYFLSFCGRYRITVDFNQDFYNPNIPFYGESAVSLHDVVLELKYALRDDADARILSQQIDARLSKNSKYVTGINMLYHNALL